MYSKFARLSAVLMVALVLSVAAQQVMAETVKFKVEGTFYKQGNNLGDKVTVDDSWLKFNPAPGWITVDAPEDYVTLGSFSWDDKWAWLDVDVYKDISFILKIIQKQPGSGSGTVVADVKGTITNVLGTGINLVWVDFQNYGKKSQVTIPGNPTVVYDPYDVDFITGGGVLKADIATYSPAAIPLPASAWMGLALLGTVAGARVLRRRAA